MSCLYETNGGNSKQRVVKKKERKLKMARSDDLDFERIKNIAEGFGWTIKKTEVKPTELELLMVKDRVEPETDITVQQT